jgi:phosphatidylglycerophosphate synthase
MLIAGNSTYHSSVIRRASEWNGRGALALTSGDQLAGIYVLSADAVLSLAERRPCRLRSLEQVHAWLILSDSVHCEPVPEEMWQRVLTHEDLISAERKLDQWLVKPTDGIFARMNRRISVPISRQIIKLPITPNAVSLFTLGVGFAAGLLLARGGYWNMLLGAVLSVSASILDGCDGEVARLKLMESDFGCWLETVCDYLYYLFIFAGITIGLWRNSETKTYLVWGGLLLLGAITSFLVAGFGRHRLANGRPEQYLRIWQAKAESRRSNPILYIGRHTEFLIRRCFLPYALLFFAALNITRVALVLSAVGANLVWLISLYSYRTFVGSRRSLVKGCAASI